MDRVAQSVPQKQNRGKEDRRMKQRKEPRKLPPVASTEGRPGAPASARAQNQGALSVALVKARYNEKT